MREHNQSLARLVMALQAALQNVRYAISGPLAIRLFDPNWCLDIGEPLDGSCSALQPSIVCPLATRDVLPSWAAVSQNSFKFDRRRPNRLEVHIGGRFVTVNIEWVDDHEFDGGSDSFFQIDHSGNIFDAFGDESGSVISPYEHRAMLDMSPPVLSLASILQNAAQKYIFSGRVDEASMEHKVLGQQVDACLRILERRKANAHDGQFLTDMEVPAVYEPAFVRRYYAEFGVGGVERLHAVCGDITSMRAPEMPEESAPPPPKVSAAHSAAATPAAPAVPAVPAPLPVPHRSEPFPENQSL